MLGNTGSGKSCTVAALIRSSVIAARKQIKNDNNSIKTPNARFIVLDPNGEYSSCFKDIDENCRVFKIPPLKSSDGEMEFKLPAWLWNSSEWAAIAQAAPRSQRPLLQEGLRNLRANFNFDDNFESRVFTRLKTVKNFLAQYKGKGAIDFPANKGCGDQLSRFCDDLSQYSKQLEKERSESLLKLEAAVSELLGERAWESRGKKGYNDFGDNELRIIGRLLIFTSPKASILLLPRFYTPLTLFSGRFGGFLAFSAVFR